MFVIIHKIIWLHIIGIMLRVSEMKLLMSKCKQEDACVVSPAFPEPSPIGSSGERIRTRGPLSSLSLPHLPQRTSEPAGGGGGRSIFGKSTAPFFIISKCRHQQKQIHTLRMRLILGHACKGLVSKGYICGGPECYISGTMGWRGES